MRRTKQTLAFLAGIDLTAFVIAACIVIVGASSNWNYDAPGWAFVMLFVSTVFGGVLGSLFAAFVTGKAHDDEIARLARVQREELDRELAAEQQRLRMVKEDAS